MSNVYSLYSLEMNQVIKDLTLGEKFEIRDGVKIRTLDTNGKIFLEVPSDDGAPVVILNEKVVLEVAQGNVGEEFSVDDKKYVLLAKNDVFVTKNKLTKDNLDKIHNFSNDVMSLIDEEFKQRPYYSLQEKAKELKQDFDAKILELKNREKKEKSKVVAENVAENKVSKIDKKKILVGLASTFALSMIALNFIPGESTQVEPKKVVEVVKTPAKKVETKKSDTKIDGLKNDLETKRKIVTKWKALYDQAKTAKSNSLKLEAYSKLITESRLDGNKALWNAYPDSKKIQKYWKIRTDKLIKNLTNSKLKSSTRRSSFALLTLYIDLLPKSVDKKLTRYENNIKSKINESWVKAVFDPDQVRNELKVLSLELPKNHTIQKDIKDKLNAL